MTSTDPAKHPHYTEMLPSSKNQKRIKSVSFLVGALCSIVLALVFAVLGMTHGVLIGSGNIIEAEEQNTQALLSVYSDINNVETLPARRALLAKMNRLRHNPRYSRYWIAHTLYITKAVNYRHQDWRHEAQLVRDSLRTLTGSDLLSFINMHGDAFLIDEYEKLRELHKTSGMKPHPRPLMPFRDSEREALASCKDLLENHFKHGFFPDFVYYMLDAINPDIATPDCELDKKLLPKI